MNVRCCILFSSRVSISIRVRIRFNVWLVGGYAHVFLLLSVVIVTLPREGSLLQLTSSLELEL